MAASSRSALGRRLGVLAAGAVVVTALTVTGAGAGLSPTSPANDFSTCPRSPVPGFLLAKGVEGPFTPIEVPGAPRNLVYGLNDRNALVGVYENTESAP
jgi:hypothetical protein